MSLPTGKLPLPLLRRALGRVRRRDPAVIVGAEPGEDAAVIDLGGPELLVAAADPITFAAADIGTYLLAVNGNDLAVMGAEPRWLLATVLGSRQGPRPVRSRPCLQMWPRPVPRPAWPWWAGTPRSPIA